MSRRRYVYRKNETTGEVESFEVGGDYTDAPRSTGDLGKFDYDCVMPDGTYVRDAADYRKYCREKGVVPSHEFKGDWAAAEKRREAIRNGERTDSEKRAHREALGREAYRRKLIRY